ncbi:peptide ABC transporter substrate-binding protein [Streptacidiphilus fuscans]|uniref:Peptide ABC transporter substrate-binding protein n=1 Tax=Streptacidiphilus fuscans TaxID=2789292 RepID=A0A931F9Q7_9ACTN|nr:peptide ABC transporter substrate-binding protein [Streptacidiphilus fuscans]MBF9066872.1 peptide ABC transporter substrate-binding protein [Streptacidiphilus fuscans]
MRKIRQLTLTAAMVTLTMAVAAGCSGGGGGSGAIGNGGAGGKKPVKAGGTVTIAETGATPNFVFPYAPATNTDGWNVNLTQPMWPALVYAGDGGQSVVNPDESLFSNMTWANGDKQVTIDLKHWNWSDGQPITSRDFSFVYNLLKANTDNWNGYVQGLFPDNVSSVSTPDANTVVINLARSYNPSFYEEDVLSLIPLLPQHAWDKSSDAGPVGNLDQTTAGAKAVYAYLQKEGGDMASFATNPLWKVVDGPWKLSEFRTDGYYSYVPNKQYSGADKPILDKVVNTPFTTDTAELNALRAGDTLDVGTLPLNDVKQASALEQNGYSVASVPIPGVAMIQPNFYNAQVGPEIQQLYVRQALEYLINRPQIVSKVYSGYADPGNGPVPLTATGPWASPLEKSGGPYPYSPSKATALLQAHGWKVVPNGATTCQNPGTGANQCGAGITAGEGLTFQLAYTSGETSLDEQSAAIKSSEAQAGITINLHSEPFNTLIANVGTCTAQSHPAATCGWQLADFGYDPYSLYPAGEGLFNSGGTSNQGGYSDPKMDQLINATEYGSDTASFYAYEDYAAQQLPWLWLPNHNSLLVYRNNLQGITPLNPFSGGLNPEMWGYTK